MTAPAPPEAIDRRLEPLRPFGLKTAVFAPLLTRTMLAVGIAPDGTVRALRCPPPAADGDPQVLSTATVADPAAVDWRPRPDPVFHAAYPTRAFADTTTYLGVVGLTQKDPRRAKQSSLPFLLFDRPNGPPLVVFPKIYTAARLTVGRDGEVYVLAPQWHPPPDSPHAAPLRLARVARNRVTVVADPLPPTDVAHNFPTDAAIFAARDGDVHIVYDGLSPESKGRERRFWHLRAGGDGKVTGVADLGPAPEGILLTAIVGSPDGSLQFLSAAAPDRAGKAIVGSVRPLKATDAADPAAVRHFVDPWVQRHTLTWDTGRWTYRGPSKIPV